MTKLEFKEVARLLKKVYGELEKEALKRGINVLSDEYKMLQSEARERLLLKQGYTLEEYREVKREVELEQKERQDAAYQETRYFDDLQAIEDKIKEIGELQVPTYEEIESIATDIATRIAEKVVKPPTIINKIVKETTVREPKVVKETVKIKERVEYNDKAIRRELETIEKKVDAIKIPKEFDADRFRDELHKDWGQMFKKNIDTLGMPDFRKLAMGLQAQIDSVGSTTSSQWTTSGSDIYYNTGKVGIGTTGAPTYKFEVFDNAATSSSSGIQIRHTNTSGYANLGFNANNSQIAETGSLFSNGVISASSFGHFTNAANGIVFAAYNATGVIKFATGGLATTDERMRITAAGLVGIGTTAPMSQLSNTNSTGGMSGSNATGIAWKSTANDWGAVIWGAPAAGAGYGLRVSTLGETSSDYPFWVSSGASSTNTLMTVRGDGNVGIGVASAAHKLHIIGNSKLTVATNDTTYVYDQIITSAATGGGLWGVEGSGTGNLVAGTLAYATVLSSTSSSTALQLGTSGAVKMTILSDGKVGIGTVAPSSLLSIDGDGTITGGIDLTAGSTAIFSIFNDGDRCIFQSQSPTASAGYQFLDSLSNPLLTIDEATGAVAVTGDLTVADEAYGAGWDASLEVPTKNAIYDKIESMGGGVAEDEVQVTTLSLSSAEILDLHNTPIQVVAAPGAGKLVVIDQAVFSFTVGGTQYSNGDNILFRYDADTVSLLSSALSNTIINAAASSTHVRSAGNSVLTAGTNKAVKVGVQSATAFINGTGTLKMFVRYRIITL